MSFSVSLEAIGVNMPKTENGQVHGLTLGPTKLTPRSTTSLITMASHSINAPGDVASGRRGGRRWHRGIVVTKVTSASANLFGHCVDTQLKIPLLKLNFLKTDTHESGHPAFTIELTNTCVEKYLRKSPPPSRLTLRVNDTLELEEISFTFQTISVTDIEGSTSTSDDWTMNP